MGKKIAIVLAGSGQRDGSEIHEATLTLLAVIKQGAEAYFFAPNAEQSLVFDHFLRKEVPERRNMLTEAARIARGAIRDLKELKVAELDALIFPGGLGAASNLCDFASQGVECQVLPEVERVISDFYNSRKALGFICIAPVIAARVLGSFGIEVTIGSDEKTASAIEQLGAKHVKHTAIEAHVDREHLIVSTPAYMLARNIAEVETGISALVSEVLKLNPARIIFER